MAKEKALPTQEPELLSSTKTFEGWIKRYKHYSTSTQTDMVFAIYLPLQASSRPVPVLYWLSGLTCNDENFMQKAGALSLASELGLAIVCPDTSPRGTDLPGEHDSYDFGSGAGFYINATEAPWSNNYRMYDYVVSELPNVIEKYFPVTDKRAISGHSMGGHGALICAFKNPGRYQSVSAFAPICHPIDCPWGQKAFAAYLGENIESWKEWDSCELMLQTEEKLPCLIHQGLDDNFLEEQLKPETLLRAAIKANYPIDLQLKKGYDHSYFFIATFINEHIMHHCKAMCLE